MKVGIFYNGSLNCKFASKQDWSDANLGVFASDKLEVLKNAREKGLEVFSYTHPKDTKLLEKVITKDNDGLFLDWSTAPIKEIEDLTKIMHTLGKKLILNTGWGSLTRTDYGLADLLMIESFIGTNSKDDKDNTIYLRRNEKTDFKRLKRLKEKGHDIITLAYGPSEDIKFAKETFQKAKDNGSYAHLYIQAPGWKSPNSGYRLFTKKDFK